MQTQLRLAMVGADPTADAENLLAWLRQEPELRGMVTVLREPPRPGEMGTLIDALTIAVGGGGTLSVLAASLQAWFARPRGSDVELEIRDPDGRTIKINAHRVADIDAVLRRFVAPHDGR